MKKQETFRFVAAIRTDNGFLINGMPEKMVDEAPSKTFSETLGGKNRKIWIIKLNGKAHKNAGTILDLPKKYQGIIDAAIREGVKQVVGI